MIPVARALLHGAGVFSHGLDNSFTFNAWVKLIDS